MHLQKIHNAQELLGPKENMKTVFITKETGCNFSSNAVGKCSIMKWWNKESSGCLVYVEVVMKNVSRSLFVND